MDLQFIHDVMLPAAAAAYTAMDPSVEIPLPDGFTLVGRIMASGEPTHPLAKKVIAESSIFGYVARNASTKTALVSIRGTRTTEEWFEDFDAVPTPFIPHPEYGLVHDGFNHVYDHIRASAGSLVGQTWPCDQLLVTGHSLGGALVILCGLDWRAHSALNLCTIAGPRVLTLVSAIGMRCHCTRVVNALDIVPQVPPPPIYEHYGVLDDVDSGGSWKPADRHGLIAYAAGLEKLIQSQAQTNAR